MSKWLGSGVENVPPHFPPMSLHIPPRMAQISSLPIPATLPTRKSTASEGQAVWNELGAPPMSRLWAGVRYPEMIQSPGQNRPNSRAACCSKRTTIDARESSRVQRSAILHGSPPTWSGNNVLPHTRREKPHKKPHAECGRSRRCGVESEAGSPRQAYAGLYHRVPGLGQERLDCGPEHTVD